MTEIPSLRYAGDTWQADPLKALPNCRCRPKPSRRLVNRDLQLNSAEKICRIRRRQAARRTHPHQFQEILILRQEQSRFPSCSSGKLPQSEWRYGGSNLNSSSNAAPESVRATRFLHAESKGNPGGDHASTIPDRPLVVRRLFRYEWDQSFQAEREHDPIRRRKERAET